MDWAGGRESINLFLKKYKWALAVLMAGLVLMMIPSEETKEKEKTASANHRMQEVTFEQELENILSVLEGAGKVKVLLSTASGSYTHYQTDEDQSKDQTSQDKRSETVIITGSDRTETGLIQRVDAPIYRGAVILCQGADRPAVKLAVVDAVSKVTGLTSDKISVWKMK